MMKWAGAVVSIYFPAIVGSATCDVSEIALLQKRSPRTNRSQSSLQEDLLQNALQQETSAGGPENAAQAEPPSLPKRYHEELFETCRGPEAMAQTAHAHGSKRQAAHIPLSCPSGIPIFDLSQGGYVCCPELALYCAGCQELSGSSCARCAAGFVKVPGEGRCEACVDTTGWTDASGKTCAQAICGDTLFKGLSSKQACCRCGGGHRAATPFTYYVAPTVLYATSITGFPVPRTASHYTINEGCKLVEYGLAIDGATGSLQIAPAAAGVGVNFSEAFSISCTIVAHQTASLSASATLKVWRTWVSPTDSTRS